jgi:hypothetical protein
VVTKSSAPTLSLYGTRDHIVEARFGRMLDAALEKAGRHQCCWSPGRSIRSTPCRTEWAGTLRLSYTERFIAWAVGR